MPGAPRVPRALTGCSSFQGSGEHGELAYPGVLRLPAAFALGADGPHLIAADLLEEVRNGPRVAVTALRDGERVGQDDQVLHGFHREARGGRGSARSEAIQSLSDTVIRERTPRIAA